MEIKIYETTEFIDADSWDELLERLDDALANQFPSLELNDSEKEEILRLAVERYANGILSDQLDLDRNLGENFNLDCKRPYLDNETYLRWAMLERSRVDVKSEIKEKFIED